MGLDPKRTGTLLRRYRSRQITGSVVHFATAVYTSYCRIVNRLRRPLRLLYREVASLPPESRSKVLGTVSDVVSYFEKIVNEGIRAGEFRDVPPRVMALDIMLKAHMIALHTRELREVSDIETYIATQQAILFLGIGKE
jgi:hypothetical protein